MWTETAEDGTVWWTDGTSWLPDQTGWSMDQMDEEWDSQAAWSSHEWPEGGWQEDGSTFVIHEFDDPELVSKAQQAYAAVQEQQRTL